MNDSDSEKTMPAFGELLGEFSSAIRGHERGHPVEKEIREAREALVGYAAQLTAENERLRIAAVRVIYRVAEWMPHMQRQAFREDVISTDFGEALAELRDAAHVVRDAQGYPMVSLRDA